jgi:xanthine dehydrogenase accessory factor
VSSSEVLIRAAELAREGRPFVLATVVGVTPPASTRRGDRALVTADGALHGWGGGACSEPLVIREALRALADGEPRLLRIGPPGS